jgi:hypothetical protein
MAGELIPLLGHRVAGTEEEEDQQRFLLKLMPSTRTIINVIGRCSRPSYIAASSDARWGGGGGWHPWRRVRWTTTNFWGSLIKSPRSRFYVSFIFFMSRHPKLYSTLRPNVIWFYKVMDVLYPIFWFMGDFEIRRHGTKKWTFSLPHVNS